MWQEQKGTITQPPPIWCENKIITEQDTAQDQEESETKTMICGHLIVSRQQHPPSGILHLP